MKSKAALTAIALLLASNAGHAENASISFWQYGGVKLRLEARGEERTWLFEAMPADYAARNGIASGATFWQGRRAGGQLVGKAYLYGAGCQPVQFDLNGSAALNKQGEIVLSGSSPSRVGGTCQIATTPEILKATPFVLKLIGKPQSIQDEE